MANNDRWRRGGYQDYASRRAITSPTSVVIMSGRNLVVSPLSGSGTELLNNDCRGGFFGVRSMLAEFGRLNASSSVVRSWCECRGRSWNESPMGLAMRNVTLYAAA